MTYLPIDEAAALSGYKKDYLLDAVRQSKLEATAVPGSAVVLKEGGWLAHQRHILVQRESLDALDATDVDGRYGLLACLAHDYGGKTLRAALHVWRGVVLDKPSCRNAREVVNILQNAIPPDDEEED